MESITRCIARRIGDLHLGDLFWWSFVWKAHHIRKLNTLMPLLEQKDFISTSGWSGFACEHHTPFLNDGTQLEPASLLPWPYCNPKKPTSHKWLKKMLHKKALAVWTKMLSVHVHRHFFPRSISINSIVQSLPKTIFSSPLGLKG